MKKGIISLLLALVACCAIHAREVTSFNEGWEFKKGPFGQDAMKVARRLLPQESCLPGNIGGETCVPSF